MPLGIESENKAKNTFLYLLGEETVKNFSNKILVINIVALLLNGKMSTKAYYRHLKECLINILNQVQKNKKDVRTLFSATYFSVFFTYTCSHFSLKTFKKPFDFIKALRTKNPTTLNLKEDLLNFLKYIKMSNKLI